MGWELNEIVNRKQVEKYLKSYLCRFESCNYGEKELPAIILSCEQAVDCRRLRTISDLLRRFTDSLHAKLHA